MFFVWRTYYQKNINHGVCKTIKLVVYPLLTLLNYKTKFILPNNFINGYKMVPKIHKKTAIFIQLMQLISRIKWFRPKTNVIILKDWEMCNDNICWTFVLTGEMKLRISLLGTRGGDLERLLIEKSLKYWKTDGSLFRRCLFI